MRITLLIIVNEIHTIQCSDFTVPDGGDGTVR